MTNDATHDKAPRRFGALISVLTPIGVLAIVFWLGLAWLVTPQGTALEVGYGHYLDVYLRVWDYKQYESNAANDAKLCVLVGASTMRESVSVEVANRDHNPEWEVLGVCSAGDGMTVICSYLDLLEEYSVEPDHVIIGISPSWFGRPFKSDDERPTKAESTDDSSGGSRFSDTPQRLVDYVGDKQTKVSLRAELALKRIRRSIHDPSIEIFEPVQQNGKEESMPMPRDRDPFREVLHGFPVPTDAELRRLLATPPSKPPMQLQSTEAIRSYGDELMARVNKWLDRKVAVTIVFLPDISMIRSYTTDQTKVAVVEQLKQMTGSNPAFRIVDINDKVPDNKFVDLKHVSPLGREITAPLISDLVVPPK